ncbi:MAG TPA: hypothetical protein VER33_26695 [Polyangiaceae bacterium]|nr:hypothetical protein [Polyangiaceae bacterium]
MTKCPTKQYDRALVRVAGWALLVLASCGGRAEGGTPEDGSTAEPDDGTSNAEPSPDDPEGTLPWSATTPLGPCKPGFDEQLHPERDCAYVADGACYETKLAACACACPRNKKHTTCSSGFEYLLPNARNKVDCF